MRTAAAVLISALPGAAHSAEAAEIVSLVGSAEKMGVVAVLVVGLYFAWQEIKRGRANSHDLRGKLVNCHSAREMWKTAFFTTGVKVDDPNVKSMLDREERLIREEKAAPA